MRPGSRKKVQAVLTIAVAAFAAAPAFSQTINSPKSGQLTFGTTLTLDNNSGLAAVSPGTTLDLSETLGFLFRSETSTQILEFSGSGGLGLTTVPGGGSTSSVTKPTGALRYTRNAANGDLNVDASYWTGDVNSTYDADPTSAVSLITDTGTLSRTRASFVGNIMTNAPLSFGINGSLDIKNYSGTTNPALFDETTQSLGATANMRLSPTTNGSISVTSTRYSSTDVSSTSYEALDLALGLSHDLACILSISGNIGYQDKRTTASGATTLALGVVGGVNVTKALPNGSVFGSMNVDLSGPAAANVLTVGRVLDFPRGTLSASVTADWLAGSPMRFLGAANYTQQTSDGSVSLDFSQSISTNNLNQDIRVSNLGVNYQKSINSVDGLNLALNLSRSEDLGGVAPTYGRATFSAAYSRALTPDWDLSVGYSRRQSSGSAVATATSDSLFLTLTRGIQFGF